MFPVLSSEFLLHSSGSSAIWQWLSVVSDVPHLPGAVLRHSCSAVFVVKGSKSVQQQLFVTPGHGLVYGPIFCWKHPHERCFEIQWLMSTGNSGWLLKVSARAACHAGAWYLFGLLVYSVRKIQRTVLRWSVIQFPLLQNICLKMHCELQRFTICMSGSLDTCVVGSGWSLC